MHSGLEVEGDEALVPLAEALGRTIDHIERRGTRSQIGSWVSTGYQELDGDAEGLPVGALTLIAGPPGVGKTALTLAITRHLATTGSEEVLYVAGRDPVEALTMRLLSYEARIPVRAMSSGRLRKDSWSDFGSAVKLLSEVPLTFLDQREVSIDRICTASAIIEAHRGLRSVFVDPLDSVRGWTPDFPAQQSVLVRLRRLAAELAVPVIAVAPLGSVEAEGQDDRDLMLLISRESEPDVPHPAGSIVRIDVRGLHRNQSVTRLAWDFDHVWITQPIYSGVPNAECAENGQGEPA